MIDPMSAAAELCPGGSVSSTRRVVVAVLTLATGVISTAPAVLTGVAGLLPTAPLVDGLRAAIQDEAGLGGAGVLLVLWGLAGVGAATAAIARHRVVDIGALARWTAPAPTPR